MSNHPLSTPGATYAASSCVFSRTVVSAAPTARPTSRFRAALSLAVLAATSAACAAAFVPDEGPSDTERQQIQAESEPYKQKGSGSISAVVGIDAGGAHITAPSGTQVYCTPATTSATKRLQEFGIEKNQLPEGRHAELMRMSRTDAQGRVRFNDLPAGTYILVSQVAWSPPGGAPRKDIAFARVRIAAGQSVTGKVTRQASE